MVDDKKIEEKIKEYEKYAEKEGFKLNPNKAIVKRMVKSLLLKEEKYGKPYCPCRPLKGDETDELKVCPCAYHKKEIEEKGHCLCLLFFKK